ncbi:MAG: peroxiredoxin-like family protein [Nevskia sp.]|nr:peroxiredoxin-like family protein [Nevskia sp.]
MRSLAQQLDDYLEGLIERADPEIVATIRRATERWLADKVAGAALKIGDMAPDFTLPDQSGNLVSLSAKLRRGPVVLTFFRGGWCPFCMISLRALAKAYPELRRHGAVMLAISPQPPPQSASMVECSALPFPVLSDHDNQVARRYGLVVTMPPDLQAVYRRLGHDLPAINGVPGWELSMPAGYVIAPGDGRPGDGRIVLAHVDPRIHLRLEPADALAAVKRLTLAAE